MSFEHWETNNDLTLVRNAKEKIKNKYLDVLRMDNKPMKNKFFKL